MNVLPPLVGWREWVGFPALDAPAIKAKVDTGARTSSLHATSCTEFERDGVTMVGFTVLPWQGSDDDPIEVELPLLRYETIKSSNGASQDRPVVELDFVLGDATWRSEFTLANRELMGFRLLLGRTALADRFVVDPAGSYLCGRPARSTRRKNRGR